VRLRRPPLRPVPETIVALIDVVFFLLVFFMLIGRMDATAPFAVLPPLAERGADLPAGGVTLSVAQDGQAALDGVALAEAPLLEALAARLAAEPALRVRLNADRAAELRHVLPLLARVEALGAQEVVLVVTPKLP
jgi:biopolymer transport protein ExbD